MSKYRVKKKRQNRGIKYREDKKLRVMDGKEIEKERGKKRGERLGKQCLPPSLLSLSARDQGKNWDLMGLFTSEGAAIEPKGTTTRK